MAGVEGQAVRGVCPPSRSRRPGRSIPTARAHLKQGVYDRGDEQHLGRRADDPSHTSADRASAASDPTDSPVGSARIAGLPSGDPCIPLKAKVE